MITNLCRWDLNSLTFLSSLPSSDGLNQGECWWRLGVNGAKRTLMCLVNNLQRMTLPLLPSLLSDLVFATEILSFRARYQGVIVGSVNLSWNRQLTGYVSPLYKHRHHVVTDKITQKLKEFSEHWRTNDTHSSHCKEDPAYSVLNRHVWVSSAGFHFYCSMGGRDMQAGTHAC